MTIYQRVAVRTLAITVLAMLPLSGTQCPPGPGGNSAPTLGTLSLTPSAKVSETVTAGADINDAENQVKLHINWGDGATDESALGASRSASLTHQYASAGTFTVTFTAIDGVNQSSGSQTRQTTTTSGGQPPQMGPISTTANSITTAAGGIRNDPEGIAAPGNVTLITWRDSRGEIRRATLGAYLYEYLFSFSDNQQTVTRTANDNAFGHPGFGYVVSHNNNNGNSPIGKANTPTNVQTTVFSCGHHAIHRVEVFYDRDLEAGGLGIKIPLVIEWLIATGRDHPVWAVTWKTGAATDPTNVTFDAYRMDTRGPYGSLNFDGAANTNEGDAIGGVAWGDFGLKFATTDAQLTLLSPWTYTALNSVNFTHIWTANINAEMGIVQTRVLDKELGNPDRVFGRERGSTSAGNYPEKGNCNALGDNRNYVVPCVTGWPYQLMNFDWDPSNNKPANEATGTKLISWGSPYGYLGASAFDLFDFSAQTDGRGDRSYATFIVLGPHCRFNGAGVCDQAGDVAITIRAVEALSTATIGNVTAGSLVTQLPRGPGASGTKNIAQGYNDTYAAYYLSAAANQASFTFTPSPSTSVQNPIFVIQNYTGGLPRISVAGAAVTFNTGAADSGAFVSLNTATNELWVTLNRTLNAPTAIQIGP